MASRALGAMFGGLEEFLKLRRGLKQDTEHREFLAKSRDLQLTQGELENVGLGHRNTVTGVQAKNAPVMGQLGVAESIARLGGPQAGEVAIKDIFKDSPTLATGLGKGLAVKAAREQVGDEIQSSQRDLQRNAAERSGTELGLFKEVVANPGDPLNNPTDYQRAVLGGVPELGRPPGGVANQWDKEAQKRAQEHASRMQNSSQNFSRSEAMATIPPGVDRATHSMALMAIKQYEDRVAATMAQINRIDAEIADNQSRLQSARLGQGPNSAFAQQAVVNPYIESAKQMRATKLAEIKAGGEAIIRTLQGLGISNPQTLQYYKDLGNFSMVGTGAMELDVAPGQATAPPPPAGPRKAF